MVFTKFFYIKDKTFFPIQDKWFETGNVAKNSGEDKPAHTATFLQLIKTYCDK